MVSAPTDALREATALTGAALSELARKKGTTGAAGERLRHTVANLYRALDGAATPPERSEALGGATRLLGECLADLQNDPGAMSELDAVLHQAARALSILHTLRTRAWMDQDTQPRLLSYAHRGAETAFRFSHDGLPLHRPARTVVVPAAVAGPEPSEEPEDTDDTPALAIAELKAMAEALVAGTDAPPAVQTEHEEPERELAPLATGARPTMTADLVADYLDRLGALHGALVARRDDPAFPWTALASTEERIYQTVDALALLAPAAIESLDEAMASAGDAAGAFAAAVSLLSIDGFDTADTVLRALASADEAVFPGISEALRLSSHPEIAPRLKLLAAPGQPPALRALAIHILAERRLLAPNVLLGILADPDSDPATATAAADALRRVGRPETTSVLESIALAKAGTAGDAALACAIAFGSARALAHLRQRIARGELSARTIELLAAAGDPADADLLLPIANRPGDRQPDAVFAVGWLGLADPTTRRSAGQPWTPATALTMLESPHAGRRERELAYLELCARTGKHVPFDSGWTTQKQRQACSAWRETLAPLMGRFAPGAWFFAGRAAPASQKRR